MTFTTKLSITAILSEVCEKGKKGVMEINKSLRMFNTIDTGNSDTQIEPILAYSSEVWELETFSKLKRCIRLLLSDF